MCLLTYFPEGVQPDPLALHRGAKINSDGHGFAIVIPQHGKAGRILVRKSMKAGSLIKEFELLRELYPDGPALFHSRITTDGETDVFNCHPFMYSGDKRTVIGHNGILPSSVRPIKGDHRSDTRIFAEHVAGTFQLHTVLGRKIASEWMGSYNKMVILTVDPAFDQHGYILNEKEGVWESGVWYSNSTFRGYRTSYYGDGSYSHSYGWHDWEKCMMKDCPAVTNTVNPNNLICTRCHHCSVCGGNPCECELTYVGKKGESPLFRTNGTGGTVIGGSPRKGVTVRSTADAEWLEEYDRQREYQRAIEAGRAASRGDRDHGTYDYGDDDPGVPTKSQLEQVLALVGVMNNGGEIDPAEVDDLISGMEAQDIIDNLPNIDALLEATSPDVPDVDNVPVGWPDGDQDADALIKRGDPNDDQDYLIHEGVRYAV